MTVGDGIEEATEKLRAVDEVNNWTRKWLIKLDEAKSVHVDCTNKRCQHIPITINDKVVPHSNTAKYLGMTLDAKLHWKARVKKKCNKLGLKYKKMYWLMGRRSALLIHNKLLLYKQYWCLCGPTAYSCGDAWNRATLTSFIGFKTRYLGTSLMHLGISETSTSIGTFKWRWLRIKLGSSLRSVKKGFSTALRSKRSSCSTTVS